MDRLLLEDSEEHKHNENDRRYFAGRGAAGLFHFALIFVLDFIKHGFMRFPFYITVAFEKDKLLLKKPSKEFYREPPQ